VPDDDRAVMERLAALEAEVKADADAQRERKEAAMAKVRDERAKQQVERDDLRQRQAQLVSRKPREDSSVARRPRRDEEFDHADGIGGALELAGKANRVKTELARKPGKGEKSWVKSAIASTALGPIGWLYAGSLREAVPAATAWVALLFLLKVLPSLLVLPSLMVLMPLSGLAGLLYAVQYNRNGGRQRLFGDKAKKQLRSGDR
jgi:hypothetical protein